VFLHRRRQADLTFVAPHALNLSQCFGFQEVFRRFLAFFGLIHGCGSFLGCGWGFHVQLGAGLRFFDRFGQLRSALLAGGTFGRRGGGCWDCRNGSLSMNCCFARCRALITHRFCRRQRFFWGGLRVVGGCTQSRFFGSFQCCRIGYRLSLLGVFVVAQLGGRGNGYAQSFYRRSDFRRTGWFTRRGRRLLDCRLGDGGGLRGLAAVFGQ
jgi:hypothetical protein